MVAAFQQTKAHQQDGRHAGGGGDGGLGGFVLPILFGALMDITGIRSSAFMLMYGVVWVSLIWMYWTEVRRTEVIGPRSQAFAR